MSSLLPFIVVSLDCAASVTAREKATAGSECAPDPTGMAAHLHHAPGCRDRCARNSGTCHDPVGHGMLSKEAAGMAVQGGCRIRQAQIQGSGITDFRLGHSIFSMP